MPSPFTGIAAAIASPYMSDARISACLSKWHRGDAIHALLTFARRLATKSDRREQAELELEAYCEIARREDARDHWNDIRVKQMREDGHV